ncbi:NucA/NucB deoxyribonuclease domain-containing protein [Streptoalloteichus hindustanus]|uniref:Deoxyribonuclease NucA/NucB n=1 Tax=Streptoalloteichus hindustanus TaxID=2017 RepID=A0A1M5D206_STRHI|nr:NucA/NucB deoxyribonuclease domain-containing protein [Streptoalloteichus hindustanus]SHF61049.1 Deoxyribonuclease NucA/NucB [Streptoalloteichus hindustanus]
MRRRTWLSAFALTALAVVAAAPQGAAVGDERERQFSYAGLTTDPRWVNDTEGLNRELLKDGVRPATMGLESPRGADSPPTVSDPTREQELAQRHGATYAAPSEQHTAPAPANRYDYITPQECRNNWRVSSRDQGWIKNHFAYCQLFVLYNKTERCFVICFTTGAFTAKVTVVGYGKREVMPGSAAHRFTDYALDMTEVRASGRFREATTMLDVQAHCQGWPNANACQMAGPNGKYTNLPTWIAQPTTSFRAYSPAQPADQAHGEQKATGVMRITYRFTVPGTVSIPDRVVGSEMGMRFDSAWYLPARQGSIFDRVTPYITFRLSDEPVKMSARHLSDAINHPEATEPKVPGKLLPGGSAENPLRRLYHDSARRTANRAEATSFCHRRWPGYPELGQDCDEFPFASTYEGAARYKYDGDRWRDHFSARPINAPDNQEAGSRLGAWYGNDRILDGDRFFVRVVN